MTEEGEGRSSMRIKLTTDIERLTESVSEHLTELGHEVETQDEEADICLVRYSQAAPVEQLTPLMQRLLPFLPRVVLVEDLDGYDAEILLGDETGPESFEVRTMTNSRRWTQRLQELWLELGFQDNGTEGNEQTENTLKYGGASPFTRQVVRWFLALEGVEVREEKTWDDDDDDIYLNLRRSSDNPLATSERHQDAIVLEGDDFEALLAIQSLLDEAGFDHVELRTLADQSVPRFHIRGGAIWEGSRKLRELRETLEAMLVEQGVDLERHPLGFSTAEEDEITVRLPLGQFLAGQMPPYSGSFPDRWDLIVRTDHAELAETLTSTLQERGYPRVRTEALPSPILTTRILWGALESHTEVKEDLFAILREGVATLEEAPADSHVFGVRTLEEEDPRVYLDVPTFAFEGVDALSRIQAACVDWECRLYTTRAGTAETLEDRLRAIRFKSFDAETDSDITEPIIKYGGAPPEVVGFICDLVEELTSHRPRPVKTWGASDDDIWIYIRGGDGGVVATSEESELPDLQAWFPRDPKRELRALIQTESEQLRVGPVQLRRRSELDERSEGLVPRRASFEHYCLDQRTAETLLHVAEAALLGEPCLLEGETSVSKTSIIQYLAMWLGQPLVRINLNGQTDTGELVGRFVPHDDDDGQGHPWRWQDGLVIEAMKQGWWVVLDELNLAEPQILERLNSVLETEPSIILTEYDNSLIGAGGTPVHESFRIFATMNPAEYAGRSTLSPAYRDRWRAYRYVEPPGESEYRAMLQFLISGRHPDVVLYGLGFRGGQQQAPYQQLASVPEIEPFLAATARFHAMLEGATVRATGAAKLGGRRRERYVFTRRGLLSLMRYLALAPHEEQGLVTMRAALARYYIHRLSSSDDRATVLRLLDAAGIGPTTWDLSKKEPDA